MAAEIEVPDCAANSANWSALTSAVLIFVYLALQLVKKCKPGIF